VEDPVRDEHAHQDLPKLRQMTTVPLAHGEEWGQRYDFNKLVEIGANQVLPPYLPECHEFKNGKLWPNTRPGLGSHWISRRCRWWARSRSRAP
jgi:L-alanine-DL-glutamate epimerase-like enolase superfamily enzyme